MTKFTLTIDTSNPAVLSQIMHTIAVFAAADARPEATSEATPSTVTGAVEPPPGDPTAAKKAAAAAKRRAVAAAKKKAADDAAAEAALVSDTGVSIDGYGCDISRTFPADGKFSPRQREVYEVALAAQDAAIAVCKPGGSLGDVHAAAWEVIADAGFADVERIVLPSPAKNLNCPFDFEFTADQRIDLALDRHLIEVGGIFLKGA